MSDYKANNEEAEVNIKDDPKAFWKFVKDNGAGVAEYSKLGEKTAFNKKDAANLFAEHFSSVYESDGMDDLRAEPSMEQSSWNELSIPMCSVYEKLQSLDTKKSSGPDKLPPLFFRRCAAALTFPLYTILNDSLKLGCFPSRWKLAHVTPIHKDGSRHDARNYRPISKLSIAAKVFDNLIADEIFERFQHDIIPQQHGFFKKRSTVTNLFDYTERLQKSLDNSGQTDVVYTDFSKAFDKVNHSKLIEKLHNLGIGGKLLEWFRSYITKRVQKVQIGESFSFDINVVSSVVQGSHLGPILFSLFINDISEILNDVEFCVFADDLKIHKAIHDEKSHCKQIWTGFISTCVKTASHLTSRNAL